MRIVAVVPVYPPHSRNGAVLTTHEYLRALAERGHDVQVVSRSGVPGRPAMLDGVTVQRGAYLVEQMIPTADVVVHHLGDSGRVKDAAGGKPRVVLAHSFAVNHANLSGAALVVWASQALSDASSHEGPSIVVHPPVIPEDYRTEPGDAVTLVGLSKHKGVKTFWRVAERLPDVQFLGVKGAWGEQIEPRSPNVEIMPTTQDMREVYGRTRILLAPSVRETYGRVPIEAMYSGIPVIAHPSPGPLEALRDADTGVRFVDRDYIDGWVQAITDLLDPDVWSEASAAARAHADTLDPTADLARFCEAVEAITFAPRVVVGIDQDPDEIMPAPEPVKTERGPEPQFAVIGTGRSGTGYMAKVLQACGVNAGHENWWKPRGRKKNGLDGDVSWLALPSIETGEWSGPVVHVTRHPVHVVQSFIGIGFWDGTDTRDKSGAFRGFALKHEPDLADMDPLEAAVEWWVRWNRRCAAVADLTVRLEDVHDRLDDIGAVIGYDLAPADEVSPTTNGRERANVDEAEVWRLLDGRAEEFGYTP